MGISVEKLKKGEIKLSGKQAILAFYGAVKTMYSECEEVIEGFDMLDQNVKAVLVNVMFQQGRPSFKKMENLINVTKKVINGEAENSNVFDELKKTSFAKTFKERMRHMKSLMEE